jgi:PAS domain S-box-containing protein
MVDALDARARTGQEPTWWHAGGEMGGRMRALDWSRTALGPVEHWPPSLHTAVSICLASRFPILIWWGPELTKLYNDAYAAIIGDKHPRALGTPGRAVWPEIWEIIGPMLAGVLQRGEATWSDDQLLPLHRNGYTEECYFTFSYSPIYDDRGEVGGIFTAVTETTTRVVGERRLATLRALGASTLETRTAEDACAAAAGVLARSAADLPFALIYLLDGDGRQARLAGVAGMEGVPAGRPAVVTLAPTREPPHSWPLARAVRTGPLVLSDLPQRFGPLPGGPWPEPPHTAVLLPFGQAGQERPAGVLVAGVSPRRALDDEYRGFLDLITSQLASAIADARANEAERARAEALIALDRAKTVFFSNISHEFRTPLTLLLGAIEDGLADRTSPLLPAQRERQEMAQRNALRLLRLVNNLLDFSRIEAGRAQASYVATDLPMFTAELASLFRAAIERAGLAFVVDCPALPAGTSAYVDRDMWEKIVLNLLSNAFKFTFEGAITVALRAVGAHIELEVRDTGTGIAPAELPRLFERFHRVQGARARTHEGTGIGLSLVRELVSLHGGAIGVESTVGRGTTVKVTIPAGSAHLPAARLEAAVGPPAPAVGALPYVEDALSWLPAMEEPPAESVLADAAGREQAADLVAGSPPVPNAADRPRVLLADDNRDMREYVARLLRDRYVVRAMPDGAAALAVAQAWQPDLVLSDVMMPRLDGFELLAALRADTRTRETPIILLSARAGEEAAVQGLQKGADDYLIKPFTARELLARVESHLQLARLRRAAAAEVAVASARAEQILRSISDAFVSFDRDWRYNYVNDRAAALLGQPRDQLLGQRVWDVFPEAVGSEAYRQLHAAMVERQPTSLEEFYPFLNRWLETRAYPFEDGLAVFFTDITARKGAEEAQARLAAIVAYSEDAIISKDLSGVITSWNGSAERLFGYNPQEAIGQPITLIIPADRLHEEPMILGRIRAGQTIEHFETVRRRKDGTLLDLALTISPIRNERGEIIGVSKIARDITQRKRAEETLAAATAKFESVFNQSGLFAGIMDLEGNLREVNDLAVHGCGYTREQVLDRPFWDTPWWRGSAEMQARIRAATAQAAAGRVFREELRYWVADGTERRVDFAMHPIRDQGGVVRFLHPTGIDITERKQLEADRLALERAREEFLAAAAHDLKTPLTAIKGTAQLAARRARGLTTPEGERLVAALRQIDGLVNSAVGQINALLDVARLQSGEPLQLRRSPVDLVQVVKEQVERHQGMGTEHTIRLRTGAPTLLGSWDGPRLERVVGNLLSNAIKYSPQGGTIKVAVQREETLTGPWAVVTVRDRGMGIPPAEVARVFERHFRGSNVRGRIDGTGIGLAGAKQIVEQHEGALAVTSRLGRGSTFTVRLPLGSAAGDRDAHA